MSFRRRLPGLLVAASLCFLPSTLLAQELQPKEKEKDKEKPKVEKEKEKPKPIELPAPPKVFDKKDPDSVADLRQIEDHTGELVKRLTPCVVNLQVGGSEGSGVVVSPDGLILTAGHVAGKSDLPVLVIFPDGKRFRGKTLGVNTDLDSGMVKITAENAGPFPYAEQGKSADLKKGQWVLTLGHPNGLKKDRPPVVRVSRVLGTTKATVTTGCYLVGGDSGGPLFDMAGKVIGIHSRIGENINENVHVPVDVFRDGWDRLVAGNNDGLTFLTPGQSGYLGALVEERKEKEEVAVASIEENSPAEEIGLKVGDIIVSIEDKKITTMRQYQRELRGHKPDEEIKIEVKRGDKTLILKPKLSKQPSNKPKSKKDKE